MPTTSNFGWTTPADTDLVKDGAAAIRTLGNGIDTSLVDLKGGTTGQILSKNSNTDLDYTWINNDQGDITEVQAGTGISVASGTGPVPVVTNTVATTFDAKGDLVVGTGADTFAKLTVGANGSTLVADSGETTGLKWAAPSGGSTFAGVSLKNTAAQSTTNVTQFTVLFDTEIYDTDGFHSTTTNTSRITIPSGKGGYYLLTASLVWGQNSTGTRYIYFFKNGSDVLDAFEDAEGYVNQTVSGVFNASAGDYFELRCYQNSGGALNVLNETRFFAAYLGA